MLIKRDDLFGLLIKAAGLDGKRIRQITCTCGIRQAPTFTVEMLGDYEQITEAIRVGDGGVVDEPLDSTHP